MRRSWRFLLAFAPLVLPAFAEEHAAKDAPPPEPIAAPPTPLSDMMARRAALQARMAKGDKDAYTQSRAQDEEVGAAIASAATEAFKVKAERDAVVVYLLSGGQPRDIAKIVERGDFPEAERGMLRGAAGYTRGGRTRRKRCCLTTRGPKASGSAASSPTPQSVLLTPKDAAKSLELLDLARLLAPGTLIEEAAMRRQILLVGDLRQPPNALRSWRANMSSDSANRSSPAFSAEGLSP